MEEDKDELSFEQQMAFEKYKKGKNIFITGPGGTGKTFLIKKIYDHAMLKNKKIQVTALTGCAAVLLKCNAKTINAWAGIGICQTPLEELLEKFNKNKNMKKKDWLEVDILVIDEVSMMSQKMFELLDAIGKNLRSSHEKKNRVCKVGKKENDTKTTNNNSSNMNKPFGGIQLIFSGDFFQLGPIAGNNDKSIEAKNFCFQSPRWKETFKICNHIELKTVFRQKDKDFQQILQQLRIGEVTLQTQKILSEKANNNLTNNDDDNNDNDPHQDLKELKEDIIANDCQKKEEEEEE